MAESAQLLRLTGVMLKVPRILGPYPILAISDSDGAVRQENRMKLHYHPSAPPFLLAAAKSFVATLLSVACILTLGGDLPLPAAPAPIPAAKDKKQKQDPVLKGLPITELSADEAILHALNRLAYGPRPGDVERVRQMGLAKWIDQQLNPNSIDDKAVEARLETYPTLRMSSGWSRIIVCAR